MIDADNSYVEWALLIAELDEAAEHLQGLTEQMAAEGRIDEDDFRLQLFHAMTHLNRVWHARDHQGELAQEAFERYAQAPGDFEPVG